MSSAEAVVALLRRKGLKLVTAESCTGGLIAGIVSEIAGASDVLERGFVTYSNDAKIEQLGVAPGIIERHGAVSAAVAVAMAEGALKHARANLSVSVTGIAGPSGGTPQKPVGLVYIATARTGLGAEAQRFHFTDRSRTAVRLESVREALRLITDSANSGA